MEPKDEAVMPPEEPLAEQLQKLLRAIELGGRAVPVSYTHLDVYKRQVLLRVTLCPSSSSKPSVGP